VASDRLNQWRSEYRTADSARPLPGWRVLRSTPSIALSMRASVFAF
jgi:hypothetical protein